MVIENFNSIAFHTLMLLALFQLFYWLFFYLRIIIYKNKKQQKPNNEAVSIIIAARNEAQNLKKNLPYFLEQNYPDFQVIVVNDASTDDTEIILAEFKQKYSNLYYTNIPLNQFFHSKKVALNVGIKAAKTDIMVFSDADCRPASENWLSEIVYCFDEQTDIVIGYGAYETKKGLLDKLVRSETVLIAMQYLSFALAGIPYMAVGRNMAYRKSFYNKTTGFSDHVNLLSGSDDLFVNKNANCKNTKVVLSADSFTYSTQVESLSNFFTQKIRHLTSSKYYKFKHKLLLGFEAFSRVMFIILAIYLLFMPQYMIYTLSIFLFRASINLVFMLLINRKLKERKLLIFEFFYEIIQPIVHFILLIFARRKKEMIWK